MANSSPRFARLLEAGMIILSSPRYMMRYANRSGRVARRRTQVFQKVEATEIAAVRDGNAPNR